MILAIGPDQRPYRFGQRNPNKETVLAAMRSFDPSGYAEGLDIDLISGEAVSSGAGIGFMYGGLLWTSEQIYNFEKHDLVLNPVFCESIVKLAEERQGDRG